jgi:hypothetical protein
MELSLRPFFHRVLEPLRVRAAFVSRKTSRFRTSVSALSSGVFASRGFRIVLTGALALAFAILAHQASSRAAIESWIDAHTPSSVLIQAVAETKGFHPISDNKVLGALLKSFPISEAEAHTLWMDRSLQCVAWQTEAQGDPMIFCRGLELATERHWVSLGTGWPAVNRLISGLEKLPSVKLARVSAKAPKSEGDPREIRF